MKPAPPVIRTVSPKVRLRCHCNVPRSFDVTLLTLLSHLTLFGRYSHPYRLPEPVAVVWTGKHCAGSAATACRRALNHDTDCNVADAGKFPEGKFALCLLPYRRLSSSPFITEILIWPFAEERSCRAKINKELQTRVRGRQWEVMEHRESGLLALGIVPPRLFRG